MLDVLISLSRYGHKDYGEWPQQSMMSDSNYWSVCPVGILVQLAVIVRKYSKNGWICFRRYAFVRKMEKKGQLDRLSNEWIYTLLWLELQQLVSVLLTSKAP